VALKIKMTTAAWQPIPMLHLPLLPLLLPPARPGMARSAPMTQQPQ
jgi:hypothetical protein